MNVSKCLLPLFMAILVTGFGRVSAKDTPKAPKPPIAADTLRSPKKETLKIQRKKGKIFEREKPERRKFDSTLFSGNAIVTRSDYMESMEKVYEMLSQVPAVTA